MEISQKIVAFSEYMNFIKASNTNFNKVHIFWVIPTLIKFIYSEKVTNFCGISTVNLSNVIRVKSKMEISQSFLRIYELYYNEAKITVLEYKSQFSATLNALSYLWSISILFTFQAQIVVKLP